MSSQRESSRRVAGGASFLLVVIVGLGIAAVYVNQWLYDEQQLPVQRVEFVGERNYVDVVRLEQLVRKSQPGSFFALDVNRVYELLESQPWVYRASVRKQWPNRLTIYIVEQKPVAYWNDDLLLNQYGESFAGELQPSSLPHLYGPGGSEKTALQGYHAMQTLLMGAGLPIKELFLSERFAWQLILDNEIEINLGRQEFIERLQRFVDVYPLLKQHEKHVDYIDLRYDTGLAVGWSNSRKSSENA